MTSVLKRGADLGARIAVRTGFLNLIERFHSRCEESQTLRVLTYHRVDEPDANPNLNPNLISATPAEFAVQMQYLAENYRVVSMEEVRSAYLNEGDLPPKSVLVTFDDGYRDFSEHAWPVLRRLRLPATLFVATAYPDAPSKTFWWDRLYAALRNARSPELQTADGPVPIETRKLRSRAMKQLAAKIKSLPDDEAQRFIDGLCLELQAPPSHNAVLGWDELRRLASEGLTLAPHTQEHPLVNRVECDRAAREIAGSIADLQRECGIRSDVFAYPSGAYCQEVVEILPSLGIRFAFTTTRGVNDLRTMNPLLIHRINVGRKTSPALLHTQLLLLSRSAG